MYVQVEGDFAALDAVRLCTLEGEDVGRALVNYTHQELAKVKVNTLPVSCP